MFDIVVGRSVSDVKKMGLRGTLLLGKQFVTMGQITTLSNKIYMDVAGAHVMFICGKRGGGKCLTGDSLINLDDGRLVQIKELDKEYNNILSLNHDLKVCSAEKEGFYRRAVDKILRIKLRSGKEIKLTPEHPLLTILGWNKAQNLKVGSRIATPRVCPNFGNLLMTECEVKLLAYLIAEGHTKKPVLFCNTDEMIVDDFKQAVLAFDEKIEVTIQGGCNYRINSRNISRKPTNKDIKRDEFGRFSKKNRPLFEKTSIRSFLEKHNLFGLGAKEKFIPDAIMMLPKHQLVLFLNRLFSCDGSIYKSGNAWRISYSSSSKKLILEVHHLLLRFGILSKIRNKKIKEFISFEIVINGGNVDKFIKEIGFFGYKQKKQQLALIERKITKNPNIDTIPKEIWDVYRPNNWAEVGKAMGYSTPKALRSSINYAPSRQKLLQISKICNDKRIKALAESDIFWDELTEIEELNGVFSVYDISVPELHNFVANDIIVHNSYTMGVVAEGVEQLEPEIKQNLAIILLDTMGIYWTMKYPNHKEESMLKEWGMEGHPVKIRIFTPIAFYNKFKEEGIPTDYPFSLNPSELDQDDWCMAFRQDKYSPAGTLITRSILELKEKGKKYSIKDIIKQVESNEGADKVTKNAVVNMFLLSEKWGVFSDKGTPLSELAKGGEITVLDVSCYATMPGGWDIKALIVGIVSQHLFIQRMTYRKSEEFKSVHSALHYFGEDKEEKQKMPLVWLVIDEAHEFLPRNEKDSNAATMPLVTIMREGRQPGISLILATQQPGKIHTDVMTQSDIVLSHRVTAKMDTEALGLLMQSYMRKGLVEELDKLPREKGAGIIFDDNNERMFPMKIRPRFTWHGGSSPTAVPEEKKKFEL